MKPISLPGLTGLRGVGALWVVAYHAQYGLNLPIADAGYLGVDLFFILSGFVLSHAHPEERWDWARYRGFLRARFARIFPMNWAALAIVGLVIALLPRIYLDMPERFSQRGLMISIALVQNWGMGWPLIWNIPAWSLSAEWLVSIAFPLFLILARWVTRPFWAGFFCAFCLGAFAAFLATTHNPDPGVVGRAGIVKVILEFAAGCLLYRLYIAKMEVRSGIALAGGGLILIGVLAPSLAVLTIFGFPVLILLATRNTHRIARAMSSAPMVFAGEISYSVYLLHWILLQVADRLRLPLQLHGAGALLWFLGYLSVVIALSTATYRLIEVPGRRLLRARIISQTETRRHRA